MACCNRMFTSSTAFGETSIPTHFLPNISAATHAVAHPQNGSRTMSPGLEDAEIIRFQQRKWLLSRVASSLFCVGLDRLDVRPTDPARERLAFHRDSVYT